MANHGGKREGAGRKKGLASILAEKTRDYIAKRIVEEQDALVTAQIEQAKKGNTAAFKELLDRGFGKVKDNVDLTTDGERLVFVPAELLNKHAIDTASGTEPDSQG